MRWSIPGNALNGLLLLGCALTSAAFVAPARALDALVSATDINPDASTNSNANASTGGRVNGLASDPATNQTFYAASEYGGLFKSTDGGARWSHLDEHLPTMTWDVDVDPGNASRVFATSWYDGRVNSLAGIEVSTDGGATWVHPATAIPPAAYVCAADRKSEPSAFGIGVRPDATNTLFVGTNCGVAISTDSGATWAFVDPTPLTPASDVWDVVVQGPGPSSQGIVDICGADGHYRSTDGGATWTGGAAALPGGRCSIAVSPDESYVLFIVASDNRVYESDDAGTTWTSLGNQGAQGRIPFVATNQRADDGSGNDKFDLWYSDTQLFRADCTTPATPAAGGTNRCPESASWTNQQVGAHWDAGALVFDSRVSVDSCPMVYSTDGGVHINTVTGTPGCHAPTWTRSNVGLHALWAWSMSGADQPGAGTEDLYFGSQDDGTFATQDAPANPPTWSNPNCCDTFDMLASPTWVLGTTCCFSSGRFNRLQLANPGYVSPAEINTYPGGTIPGFTFGSRLARFGATQVALIMSGGLEVTADIQAAAIVWTNLGSPPAGGATMCSVQSSSAAGTPVFYVQVGDCSGSVGDQVWFYTGTAPGGTWTRIDTNDGLTGGFGTFGVDPNDSNRIYASNLAAGGPQVIFSTDAGTTWSDDATLDAMMTGGGVFAYQNTRGPSTRRNSAAARFIGYVQPSLFAFDPEDSDVIVAGGIDSGVFISTSGGARWTLVSDPFTGHDHIPRPRYAYFDHEASDAINVYIGTQGRGTWRITLVGGTVKIVKLVDSEPDGVFDDDPSGWIFDVFDDGEPTQTTDATGLLEFLVAASDGPYDVKETAPPVTDSGLWLVTAQCVDDDDGSLVGTGVTAQLFGPPALGLPETAVSGVELDPGDSLTCAFENQKMAGFLTGGGHLISAAKRKNANWVTFAGNAGIGLDGSLRGHWQTHFQRVSNPAVERGTFHSESISGLVFGDNGGEPPDPPSAVFNRAHFEMVGRFGSQTCTLSVDATDHGEPAAGANSGADADGIRIRLDCPGTSLDYDSLLDFPEETPVGLHDLDGGNLQIHPPRS